MTAAAGTRLERVRALRPDRLEALLVGAGPHLEAVLDVGSTPGGDLLLVLPAPATRLTEVVAVPGWPTRGEAVTVLVPLAQALLRLHAAGVASTAADAAHVHLDADGAPLWRLPPEPVLLRRAGPAAFAAAAAADRARFTDLASALVARAGGALPGTTDLAEVIDALFAFADPVPVRLRPRADPAPDDPAAGVAAPVVSAPAVAAREDRAVLPGPRVRAIAGRAVAAARTVRRRMWVAVAAVGCALLAAVVLLPSGGAGASAPLARSTPGSTPSAASSLPTRAPAPVPRAGPVAPRVLDGAAAVRRLIPARASCLDRGTAACLTQVDAVGSPVSIADAAVVRSGADGARPGGTVRLLSSGGGTVVTAVGRFVVVAIRERDGWRLRDVVAEPPR